MRPMTLVKVWDDRPTGQFFPLSPELRGLWMPEDGTGAPVTRLLLRETQSPQHPRVEGQ